MDMRINAHHYIRPSKITDFSYQLATLLEAGIPLIKAMDIAANSDNNKKLRLVIQNLKSKIQSGETLTEALRYYPRYFNNFYCNIIYIGEQTGNLAQALQEIVYYRKKLSNLSSKFINILLYPLTLVIIAGLITYALLACVVPRFQELFTMLDAKLPLPTQFILNSAQWTQQHILCLLTFFIMLSSGFALYWQQSSKFNQYVSDMTLKLPLAGKLIRHIILSRLFTTLTTLLKAGVPLLNAIDMSAYCTHHWRFIQALQIIKQQISSGITLHQAFYTSQIFPNKAIQMIAVGEESGNLEKTLMHLAEYYDEEANQILERYGKLLEPALILLVSFIIGGIMLAMYLPMFRLGAAM